MNPTISIAGIFLVGAMYGFNAPGAHAENVTCDLTKNLLIYTDGTKTVGPAGTMHIDLAKQTATLCSENGCANPHAVNVIATRSGFEFSQHIGASTFYAKVDGTKYSQVGTASNGTIIMGSGVCY